MFVFLSYRSPAVQHLSSPLSILALYLYFTLYPLCLHIGSLTFLSNLPLCLWFWTSHLCIPLLSRSDLFLAFWLYGFLVNFVKRFVKRFWWNDFGETICERLCLASGLLVPGLTLFYWSLRISLSHALPVLSLSHRSFDLSNLK